MLHATSSDYGNVINLEQYSTDSRLTEPFDGKNYDYRKMVKKVNSLGRSLTEEEAEKYRI